MSRRRRGKDEDRAGRRPRRRGAPAGSARPAGARGGGAGLFCVVAVVVALTLFAFAPAADNDFVDWDDFQNLTRNEHIRSLSGENLTWMLTATHLGVWQPVSWLVAAVEYQLFDGADERAFSRGMHRVSVALHALAAVLCFVALRELLAAAGGRRHRSPSWPLDVAAGVGALIFAVHPLRSELVAWATAQPYVLALIFALVSVAAYLRAAAGGGRHWWLVSIAAYAVSLMCKSIAVPLVAVLVLMDFHPLGRLPGGGARVWREKIPYAVLAGVVAVVAPLAKEGARSALPLDVHGPLQRFAQACYGLVFGVWRTLVPLDLSPIYELRTPLDIATPRYVISMIAVAAVATGLVLLARRRTPGPAVAFLSYALVLAPVLGFFQAGSQEVADRYTYLPAVALSALFAGGVLALLRGTGPRRSAGVALAGLLVVLSLPLAVLTRAQCRVWKDTASLWRHAVRLQEDSTVAQNGYGYVLLQERRYDEAIVHFRRAIALRGDNEMAHRNLWGALQDQRRNAELIVALEASTRMLPGLADVHHHLGNAHAREGRFDEAADCFRQALALDPNLAVSHRSLASVLLEQGDRAGAIAHARQALALDPSLEDVRVILAGALRREGKLDEAVQMLEEERRVHPNNRRAAAILEAWTARGGRSGSSNGGTAQSAGNESSGPARPGP